eukprot:CAMPEP_0202957106 /NCGR_PEP_ID=MMETSP1396-20130829/1540_1 /ASSEMBLY_ACC=CAM_ASM_000872 /TAXON_ID= /ORGANISM="Pseudokeronopsis sp., Strain Brazil" /LENGTH=93 /DNA_ID=CAMNT_0049674425 /DNA_START=86 /DNA_END=367 /DNA_ORIENTATION=+
MACAISGSTYTWWEENGYYKCSDSFWDESICPLYSTCTYKASTCEVATSQYLCPEPAQLMQSVDCGDKIEYRDLEGDYVVIKIPAATYCTVSI